MKTRYTRVKFLIDSDIKLPKWTIKRGIIWSLIFYRTWIAPKRLKWIDAFSIPMSFSLPIREPENCERLKWRILRYCFPPGRYWPEPVLLDFLVSDEASDPFPYPLYLLVTKCPRIEWELEGCERVNRSLWLPFNRVLFLQHENRIQGSTVFQLVILIPHESVMLSVREPGMSQGFH